MSLIWSVVFGTIVILNPYRFQVVAVGGAGNLVQEDGTSLILQQDSISKIQVEFQAGGFLLIQDAISALLQEDSISKIRQE
jgi:hypothetical protein